jgi:anti-anti-sigma factor
LLGPAKVVHNEERKRSLSEGWSLEVEGEFAITQRTLGGGALLIPCGDLDLATVDTLDSALRQAENSHELVVLDLRQVPFMDSSGLHALIAADLRMRERDGRLVVVQGGDQIRRLLGLTGADTQLEVVYDPDEALANPSDSPAPTQ